MTGGTRQHILDMSNEEITVEDDGTEFVLRSQDPPPETVVLRWRVSDVELEAIFHELTPSARAGWGRGGQGYYIVINELQELIFTNAPGEYRVRRGETGFVTEPISG